MPDERKDITWSITGWCLHEDHKTCVGKAPSINDPTEILPCRCPCHSEPAPEDKDLHGPAAKTTQGAVTYRPQTDAPEDKKGAQEPIVIVREGHKPECASNLRIVFSQGAVPGCVPTPWIYAKQCELVTIPPCNCGTEPAAPPSSAPILPEQLQGQSNPVPTASSAQPPSKSWGFSEHLVVLPETVAGQPEPSKDEEWTQLDAVVTLLRAKCTDAEWDAYPDSLKDVVPDEIASLRAARDAAKLLADEEIKLRRSAERSLAQADAELKFVGKAFTDKCNELAEARAALQNFIDCAITDADTCVICQQDFSRHSEGCAVLIAQQALQPKPTEEPAPHHVGDITKGIGKDGKVGPAGDATKEEADG